MAEERFIVAIGRIERALSRIEKMQLSQNAPPDVELADKHQRLKNETQAAIKDLDAMLKGDV
jgi:hypothetical protein